jgi:anti-sigma B factor antagonist
MDLAMDEALTIEIRHEQGNAIVTAAGEIDISTATRLRERLFEIAASGCPLVVDLDQVSFIDSAGLAVLVGTAKHADASGGSLCVACGQPKIRKLFRLTGLDHRMPLARTLDEALETLLAARTTSLSTTPRSPAPRQPGDTALPVTGRCSPCGSSTAVYGPRGRPLCDRCRGGGAPRPPRMAPG